MIQSLLDELKATWSFDPEELADIKEKMAHYAVSAVMDSHIQQEALTINNAAEEE